ncbi:MAG: ribosome biogenesis GTP-binding protein YihA/YsxC [Bauldia sp.]
MADPVSDEIEAAKLEAGRRMFARPWRFLAGVAAVAELPAPEGIEVAFAGRSNVGKSSLINALTGRKALAKTSNAPGRTRQLNRFGAEADVTVVDMPGYGYARAPKKEIAAWTRTVFDYLRGRANLRRVYLLVDARHGLKANDREALDVLDKAAVSYQVVLTKCDKPKPAALDAVVAETRDAIAKRPAAHPQLIATSAATGTGIDALRAEIAGLVRP